MNNAELVRLHRALEARQAASPTSPSWNPHRMIDRFGWDIEHSRRAMIQHDATLPPITVLDLRWVATMRQTPWVYCHDCGEITTALDGPLNTPCACWDEPPSWVDPDLGDLGYDPAEAS